MAALTHPLSALCAVSRDMCKHLVARSRANRASTGPGQLLCRRGQ
jgi:hypothetical protein